MNKNQRKLIFYSGLGGLLEFYDFIIFALLAPVLATQFFPAEDRMMALLATFATFSVGYLVRPLGGVIFAHFGDRYGRKNVFLATIILMAFSTLAIALIPPYQSIGITATVLLVCFRILQGFSVGGEIPGAITYISESMPEKRSLATAIIFFFLLNGITLGSFLNYLVANSLTPTQFTMWGWRCLFIAGGIFGFLGFIFRRKMTESPLFMKCENYVPLPFITVLRESGISVILTSFIAGLGAAFITTLYLFLPTYFKQVINFTPPHFLVVFTLAMFVSSICTILFGLISQRIYKPILIALFALIGLLTPIAIFQSYIEHQNIYLLIMLSGVLIGGIWGVIPALIAEFFPTQIRYSGIATCYNLGFAIFGGLAPVISLFLIKATGKLYAPAYYLIALSGIVLLISIVLIIKWVLGSINPDIHFEKDIL